MKSKGYSLAEIGQAMGRAKSAIWNELRRNKVRGSYDSKKAHHKAYVRRKYARYQGKRITDHDDLRAELVRRLKDGQSPEAIARRIAGWESHLPSISKDAIYRWLATSYGAPLSRWLLKRKLRRRRPRHRKLENRTFIEKRPRIAERRGRIGDAEFDFVVSGKSGKGILLVVVDRKARMAFIERISPVSIRNFEKAFLRIRRRYPEIRTGTTDNDILLQHHARLAKMLRARIFFCHPYHSWEKGTVENANGIIRRSIPKGADISRYSRYFIGQLEQKLNRRPMKCLDYRTPEEVMAEYRARKRKTAR